MVTSSSLAFGQAGEDEITIREIQIEGNRKTKERYITRELSFKPDETYTRAQLDSMFVWNNNRIYNTNLFNSVDFSIVNELDGEADILITVDERWYLYPVPIFRLVDRNFNDWWVNRNRDLSRVNYGMRITQFNFRGRGEFLRLWLQTGFTNVVSLQYRIPYIDKKQNNGLAFALSYFEAKNVAVTTQENIPRFTSSFNEKLRKAYRYSVIHTHRSSFYSFHHFISGYYNIQIADTVAALNPNYLGDGQTSQQHFWLGYNYSWDKRNNRNYPTEGEWYRASINKHGLGVFDDGVDYWRIRAAATKYWEFKDNFYAVANIVAFSTFPAQRDYFNYYKIGLLNEILRGYDLNVIEGSSYVMQRNEFKHKLFGRKWNIKKVMPIRQFQTFPFTVYGKVYFDQGWARSYPNYNGSDLLTDRYLYSFGAGLDFVLMNDAVIRLEYSRNALNQTNLFLNFLTLF